MVKNKFLCVLVIVLVGSFLHMKKGLCAFRFVFGCASLWLQTRWLGDPLSGVVYQLGFISRLLQAVCGREKCACQHVCKCVVMPLDLSVVDKCCNKCKSTKCLDFRGCRHYEDVLSGTEQWSLRCSCSLPAGTLDFVKDFNSICQCCLSRMKFFFQPQKKLNVSGYRF